VVEPVRVEQRVLDELDEELSRAGGANGEREGEPWPQAAQPRNRHDEQSEADPADNVLWAA
jgi:hypothetical protein